MQLLDHFKGLGPFSAWLVASLVLGIAVFAVWDRIAKRAARMDPRDPRG
jgi:hypothetical protein